MQIRYRYIEIIIISRLRISSEEMSLVAQMRYFLFLIKENKKYDIRNCTRDLLSLLYSEVAITFQYRILSIILFSEMAIALNIMTNS